MYGRLLRLLVLRLLRWLLHAATPAGLPTILGLLHLLWRRLLLWHHGRKDHHLRAHLHVARLCGHHGCLHVAHLSNIHSSHVSILLWNVV